MMEPCDCGDINCPICGVIWDIKNNRWIGKPQKEEDGERLSTSQKKLTDYFYELLQQRKNEREN